MPVITKIKFDISEVDAGIAKMIGVLESRKVSQAMVTSLEERVTPAVRIEIRANKSVFEGTLFRSISALVISRGSKHVVEFGTFGADHGLNIEKGTPSGRGARVTPKLVRWARLKLGAKQPVSVAHAIARSIANKGSKARPFLVPGWDKSKGRFVRSFRGRLKVLLGNS